MSPEQKSNDTNYRKQLDLSEDPATPLGENDNAIVKNKCFVVTSDNSASSIGFNTPQESNNCPYMLRKRFKFVDGSIILKFSEETLFIRGKHLKRLHEKICRHKVTDVFIADYDEDDSEDPYVESITLKLNSEVNIDELPTEPDS